MTEMVGLEVFTEIDADVQLVEVRGYDELWRRLEQHLPPEVMEQLEATMGSEAILENGEGQVFDIRSNPPAVDFRRPST